MLLVERVVIIESIDVIPSTRHAIKRTAILNNCELCRDATFVLRICHGVATRSAPGEVLTSDLPALCLF